MVLAWQPISVDSAPDDPLPLTADPAGMVDALDELLAAIARPAWHREAACRGQGTAGWFPARGAPTQPAKAVCHGCPVRSECLAVGLEQPGWGDAGIWGGTSARERRQLRKSPMGDAA